MNPHNRFPGIRIFGGALCLLLSIAGARAQSDAVAARPKRPVGRRIYVPFDQLDVVIDRDKKGVLLPRAEFQKLYAAARHRTQAMPRPPREIVLSAAEYQARISGSRLVISASIEFSQFVDDWKILTLPLHEVAVESATLDGKPARLGRDKGVLQLLNNRAGRHTLTMQLSTPLTAVGSDKVAAFGLVPAPSGVLNVTIPAGRRLLADGLSVTRPAAADQPAVYRIAVGGKPNIWLQITQRKTKQSIDSLVFAQTRFGVNVSPGEVTWLAETSVDVYGRTMDRLVFSVPRTLEITDVTSTGLESWRLDDSSTEAGRTRITLAYRQPFDGTRRITFKGVLTPEVGKPWTVPNLKLSGATSHVGRILVTHPAGVRLKLDESTGVRSVPIATVQPTERKTQPPERRRFRPADVASFDVWREDFTLRYITETKHRELSASTLTTLNVTNRGIELKTAVNLRAFYAPLFEFDTTLPAAWRVTAVEVRGKPIVWNKPAAEAGVRQVRIPLDPPLAAGRQVQIVLSARRDFESPLLPEQPSDIALPEVRLPQVSILEGVYAVSAEQDFDIEPVELTGLDPASLKIPGIRLGYRYQDTRFSGRLKITRRPSRISARTLQFTRLDPHALRSHIETTLDILGGSLRALRVALPAETGQDLRFRVIGKMARIVEQEPAKPADGERVWVLLFDRRVRGRLVFAVDVESPRGKAKQWSAHRLRIPDAERQNGILAIEAGPEQWLTLSAQDADKHPLDDVDPAEIPPSLSGYVPRERIVAAYRYSRPRYAVSLAATRLDRLAVPTAVGYQSAISCVLGHSGELRYRTELTLSAVGVQSLRVELPEDAVLWATLLDGRPVEIRHRGEIYLIPLPPTGHPTARRKLVLFYTTRLADPLSRFGRIEQQPPRLSVLAGDGKVQPIEMLDRTWTLSYPPDVMLIGSDGRFRAQNPLDRSSLLGQFEQSFRVGSPMQILWGIGYVAVGVVVVLLLTLGYRRYHGWGIGVAVAVMAILGLLVLVVLFIPGVRPYFQAGTGSIDTAGSKKSAAPAMTAAEMDRGAAGRDREMTDDVRRAIGRAEDKRVAAARAGTKDEAIQKLKRSSGRDHDFAFTGKVGFDDAKRAGGKRHTTIAGLAAPDQFAQAAPNKRPPAAPAESNKPQGGRPLSEHKGYEPAGARLSLAVNFVKPVGNPEQTFRYFGSAGDAVPDLNVVYQNRRAGLLWRLLLFASILFGFWIVRARSVRVRGIVAALGMTVPLALVSIAPVSWDITLDGLFLGSLGGTVLWWVRAMVLCCPRCGRCCGKLKSTGISAGLLLMLIVLPHGDIVAAPPKSTVPPSPVVVSPVVVSPDIVSPRPTIVIPYDPKFDPLSAERVYLPHAEFVKLWNQAHPRQRLKRPAPSGGLVAGVLYNAELKPGTTADKGHVTVTARMVLYNLRDQAVTLPLPLGAVALRSAQLDGKSAPLISGATSISRPVVEQRQRRKPRTKKLAVIPYQIVLTTPGIHLLDLEFDLPAERSGPAGRFQIPLRAVPAGRLRFALPSADLNVRVNGTTGAFVRRTVKTKPVIDVPVDSGGNVTISWQPRTARASENALTHGDTTTMVLVDDAGVTFRSDFRFRVRQGALSDVTFSLPGDIKLEQIRGADVGGWERIGSPGKRAVRVFLRRKVTDATTISFVLFRSVKIGTRGLSISLPQFAPQNVVRETGTIGILAASQFSVRGRSRSGLKQIDATAFALPKKRPSATKHPVLKAPQLAYRYTSRPIALTLAVTRRQPAIRTTADQSVFIGRRKVRIASRFSVDLTGAPRSRLTFYLPEDYLPLTVVSRRLSDWYLNKGDEETTLTVELNGAVTGNVVVYLDGVVPKEPFAKTVDVEIPSPLDVSRLTSRVAVRVDSMYSATLDRTDLEGWRSIDPAQLPAVFRRQKSRPVQFALLSRETEPALITFGLSRAKVQLTAAAVTITTLAPTAVNHTFALEWSIRRATLDHFSFLTPAAFKDRLEFTGTHLRQITQTELPDGKIRWTVITQQPVAHRFFLIAMATLPPPTTDLTVPVPVFQQRENGMMKSAFENLETQRRYGVLVNQSLGQLTPVDAEGMETIEATDLPIRVRQTLVDQAMEIVRFPPGEKRFHWKITRFTPQKGAAASVNLADLVTVFERDGSWRAQATYTLRNRSRQFLAVEMPEGSRLLSVFVQKRPARPVELDRNGRHLHLIALPKTSAADLSFPVRVFFSGRLKNGPLAQGPRIARQHIRPPSPKVLSPADDPEFGIPVARTVWTIWLPKGLDAKLLDDPDRSNLTEATASRVELARRKLSLQDAETLVNLYDSSESGQVKANALKNLGRLQQKIRNMSQAVTYRLSGNGATDTATEAGERAAQHEALKYRKEQTRIQRELESRLNRAKNRSRDYHRMWEAGQPKAAALRQQFKQRAGELYSGNSAGQAFRQNDVDGDGLAALDKKIAPSSGAKGAAAKKTVRPTRSMNRVPAIQRRQGGEKETAALFGALANTRDAEKGKRAGQGKSKKADRPAVQNAPPRAGSGGGLGGGGWRDVQGGGGKVTEFETTLSLAVGQTQTGATGNWTQAGGLSLEITLPRSGQKLAFSKVGGDPQLELALRPRKTLKIGFGLIWTVIWLVIGLGIAAALYRGGAVSGLRRHLPKGMVAVGLSAFFLLPGLFSWIGFALFFLGALAVGYQYRTRPA